MDPEPLHILLERASSSSERDEENRGPSLVLTGVLLLTIATLVVSGRIYCRAVLIRRMGPDDWCMIFATIMATPIVVMNCISVAGGVGHHTWTTERSGEQQAIMLGWFSMLHYFLALGLTKCSLLLFLIRLGPGTPLCYTSWGILVFVTLYTLIAFVLSAIQCMPVSYMWGAAAAGKCMDRKTMGLVLYSISIATDFAIWVVPLKTVWRIRMPTRQKVALIGVFSLGSLSVLAGFLRLRSVIRSFTTKDPMYDNTDLGIWSLVEVLIGIICGSAPAVKPLFSKFLPGFLGNSQITPPELIDNVNGQRIPGRRSWGGTTYALGSVGGGAEGASTEGFRGAGETEPIEIEVELEPVDLGVAGKNLEVELADRV
ncbi:uncharacterized protein H6S33_011132 [Morchella sextelata]|uniref:uncharacterized protein n=1 Tax=Morchella sextelata TaxID=1174677 RepID=UPI001D03F75E|nr:uncharacterized protein H6S33_011132 [Morchella sextelata]KAH0611867.1 hypothetical protein H6S33_011132 [Morchella sextelata]